MSKGAAGYERRTYPIEFRVDGDGGDTRISGHAAVYNELSEEMGIPGWFTFREKLADGAFDEAAQRANDGKDDVYALLNHDENFIVAGNRARSGPGSLKLSVDERGLFHEVQPLETQTVRDLVIAPMRAGILRKMSFGFTVDSEHEEIRDKQTVRVIDKVARLFDVSYVAYPAYPQTDVQARAIFDALKVDPAQLSTREQIALRSFVETFSRHLAPIALRAATECARDGCGHAESQHPDGGACEQDDGCESYMAPKQDEASRALSARSAQAGAQRDGTPASAGADVDALRRRLELEMRTFEYAQN